MNQFYFDDSVHDRGDFIIGGFVHTEKDLTESISNILTKHGFDSSKDEFKSSRNFTKEPKMSLVRDELKSLVHHYARIGVVVIPRNQRENLGYESIKALKQFITVNEIISKQKIFYDQGIFHNKTKATELIQQLNLSDHEFYFEQNSNEVKGIQLADLCAHTTSIMLLEALGIVTKKVKAGENSGYHPDEELDIGFEMWASIRYNFFMEKNKNLPDDNGVNSTYSVEPYGLYISEYCDSKLSEAARERFGKSYLGCIH